MYNHFEEIRIDGEFESFGLCDCQIHGMTTGQLTYIWLSQQRQVTCDVIKKIN